MPYIGTKTTKTLTEEKKAALAKRFGTAITTIPGKSEAHLMLGFEGDATMYFGGKTGEPMAFVEVMLFGTSDREHLTMLTKQICDILKEELGIDGANTYVKYEEVAHWGWNGSNF